MSWHRTGWDDTIRPSRPFNIGHLSLSPENKRKRRHDDVAVPSPTSVSSNSASTKKARFLQSSASVRRRVEALDRSQLLALVEELVERDAAVAEQVEQLVPLVTPAQAVSALKSLLGEVKSRIPLGDAHGDYAFLRVRPQWTTFFSALSDHLEGFLDDFHENDNALVVLEFLDGVSTLVHEAPRWSTLGNNQLLTRAYAELEHAWLQMLEQESSLGLMAHAAWAGRFRDHCVRSRGAMSDAEPTTDEHRTSVPSTVQQA